MDDISLTTFKIYTILKPKFIEVHVGDGLTTFKIYTILKLVLMTSV